MLTGAKAAFESGPSFALSYGMSKAATHHLAKSIEDQINTVCILPTILKTPANRAAMPDADTSTWTDLETVASQICNWCENPASVKTKLFIDM